MTTQPFSDRVTAALAARGAYVPMIAGRGLGHTRGTLDKLEAIPGFRADVPTERLCEIVEEIGCAIVAVPVWWLLSRLRSAYFSIATWVIASAFYYIIILFPSLGGGTGMELPGPLLTMNQRVLGAYTYWVTLFVVVAAVGGVYLVLRSRLGLVLTAVRDDEIAARSSGGRVGRAQRFVFVVAAAGCGAAGAMIAIYNQSVDPGASFTVLWSARMIFAVVIGGIGTIEGPILGAIIFYALQQSLASHGAWYFIVLGLVAIAVALWARRGLWGILADRLHIRIFPVGYWLWPDGEGWRRRGIQGRRPN